MDIKEQILVALGLNDKAVSLEWQAKSEDGTIFVSTADELAEGVDVSVLTEDGTTILLPIGEYKTEEGISFRVEVEGIVAEVLESEEEVAEEGAPVEEEEVEMAEEADIQDLEGMEKRIKNLEDAVASLKGEEKDTEEEVEELAEETEVEVEERGTTPKSIKTTVVEEFSEVTLESLQAENDKLKTELKAQPAASPLNTNKFSEEVKPLTKQQLSKMTSQERFLHNLNN